MPRRNRRLLISAGVAAALWLLSGLANVVAASNVYAGRVLRVLVPTPTNALFWSWPPPWSFLALLFAGTSIGAVVLLVLKLVMRGRRGRPPLASAWFAVIVAGAITGLAIDGIVVLSSVQIVGWRALALTSVEYAVVGAYWGLVQGWIPALIASRVRDDVAEAAPRAGTAWFAGIAVIALVAFTVTGTLGADANRRAIAQEQATADGLPPELGAALDPAAPGSPPPTAAPSAVERDPSWCTPEQATMLLGSQDAATGHRVVSIRLMNFSDAPCVVDGYPDVAFGDQNGNALNVAVAPGSSFMAQDAGDHPIELPPGGYAIASIGWDANATAGALVATKLYAAQVAGDPRGSWPVVLDVVDGSSVEITAWELDEPGPATEG